MLQRHFFLSILLLFPGLVIHAAPILYEVTNLSGSTWEYTYTIENEETFPIEEFTIWFDLGVYENLQLTGSPSLDWDGFVAQPDIFLPDDGFADWFALGALINPGETLSGFSVSFDYLASGTPGTQFFELIDPLTFDSITDGFTQLKVNNPVPLPGTFALLSLGLALVGGLRRRITFKSLIS